MRSTLFVLAACSAFAQAPAFEVASVKRSEPLTPELVQSGRVHMGVTLDNRSVRIGQLSLVELIVFAYQVKFYEISAPQWMSSARFDIQAKLPDGASRGQVPAMMQTLLAERFALKLHREPREMSVLALVQAKDGHKLKPSAPVEPGAPAPQIRGGTSVGPDGSQVASSPDGDSFISPRPGGGEHVEVKKMTMARFAGFLNRFFERPVIDMTGVTGRYDAEFDIGADELRNAARAHGVAIRTREGEASDPTGPTMKASLEKLGLRIEGRKQPIQMIVVDSAEKTPTEN